MTSSFKIYQEEPSKSFSSFMDSVLSGYYIGKYGKWVSGDYLKSLAFLMQHQEDLIAAIPRFHSKTTMLIGYVCWMIYKLEKDQKENVSFFVDTQNMFHEEGTEKMDSYIYKFCDIFEFFGLEYTLIPTNKIDTYNSIQIKNKGTLTIYFNSPHNNLILVDDESTLSFVANKRRRILALGTPKKHGDLFDTADIKFEAINSNNDILWPERFNESFFYTQREIMGPKSFSNEYLCSM